METASKESAVARRLARYLIRTQDLPERARSLASMLVASTIASAGAGRVIESSSTVCSIALAQGGNPDASIWFESESIPTALAARTNATMSSASASDSTDLTSMAHPATPIVAASLAVGEHLKRSGRDVVEAIVVGYEAANRIGRVISPAYKTRGFHGCLVEVFGAALASARLLGAGEDEATHALALSASCVGGLMAAANTSLSREYQAGLAAMLGVEASLAAIRGYTGEEAVLEKPGGFFEVYGDGTGADPLDALGHRWGVMSDMAVKLIPGGAPHHATVEAAINAARKGDVSPEEVDTLILSKPGVTTLPGPRHPTDLVGAAHSAAYFLAAGVADRDFNWSHATSSKFNDPVIRELEGRVRVGPPPTDNVERYRQGATVTIVAKDGRRLTDTVYVARGAASEGLSWDEVDGKYRTLLSSTTLPERRIEESLMTIHDFDRLPDVSTLMSLLRLAERQDS